jgi:glycogen operon protein
MRNLLATLFLSQGVPMILSGDEIGRTQGGNNNAYCQDNEISWLDWETKDEEMLGYFRALSAFRSRHSAFRRRRWFQGRPLHGAGASDIAWFSPEGSEMSDTDWQVSFAKTVGVFLSADGRPAGKPPEQSYFLIFNAFWEPLRFVLPEEYFAPAWRPVLDTASEDDPFFAVMPGPALLPAGAPVDVSGRSLRVLQAVDWPLRAAERAPSPFSAPRSQEQGTERG